MRLHIHSPFFVFCAAPGGNRRRGRGATRGAGRTGGAGRGRPGSPSAAAATPRRARERVAACRARRPAPRAAARSHRRARWSLHASSGASSGGARAAATRSSSRGPSLCVPERAGATREWRGRTRSAGLRLCSHGTYGRATLARTRARARAQAGMFFGAGWSMWCDAVIMHGKVPFVHWLGGILATLSALFLNMVSKVSAAGARLRERALSFSVQNLQLMRTCLHLARRATSTARVREGTRSTAQRNAYGCTFCWCT